MDNTVEHRLIKVVADMFLVAEENITPDMKPGDIPRWDSLGHINLIEAIPENFGVSIPLEEGLNAESLKDLICVINELMMKKE